MVEITSLIGFWGGGLEVGFYSSPPYLLVTLTRKSKFGQNDGEQVAATIDAWQAAMHVSQAQAQQNKLLFSRCNLLPN